MPYLTYRWATEEKPTKCLSSFNVPAHRLSKSWEHYWTDGTILLNDNPSFGVLIVVVESAV